MNKYKTILLVAFLGLTTSCTQNTRVKSFGGTANVDLPPGTKLIAATWKNNQLWYLHRPSREGEKPETLTLQERSSFGVLEGKVIFQEH